MKARVRMTALVAELLGVAALAWGLYAAFVAFAVVGLALIVAGLAAFALVSD